MSYVIDFINDKTRKVFGVIFDGSTSQGRRLYDSRGLRFIPSNTTEKHVDDFYYIEDSPFHIKEVVTKYNSSTGKQDILAYEGDANWSSAISDSNHNRMIEFPKFWYKRPSKWEFVVTSDEEIANSEGFSKSPMHYRNGVMHDYVYVAKYHCDNNFKSQSGKTPNYDATTASKPIAYFRNGFRNQGMFIYDYPLVCSINMLMIIKYANLDVQKAIGWGYSMYPNDTANVRLTGGSDNVKGVCGYSGASGNTDSSTVTFGICDYYSNVSRWVDGIYRIKNEVFINEDIESITSNSTSGYTKLTTNIVNSSDVYGWITDISYDSQYKYCMFPTSITHDSSTNWNKVDHGYKVNDGYWNNIEVNNTSQFYFRYGGGWNSWYPSGLFTLILNETSNGSNRNCNASSFFLS